MGRLTLYGMLKYDPTLFDECILPAGYDKEALIDEILTNSGDLYPYHQQPIILKKSMRLWFSRNYLNFDRIMDAITAHYNPIENYDRYEDWTRKPDLHDEATSSGSDILRKEAGQTVTDSKTGNDTITHTYNLTEETARSGTDTVSHTGTDNVAHTGTDETSHETTDDLLQNGNVVNEHKVSAFDSDTYSESYQDTQTFNNKEDKSTIKGLDSRTINTGDNRTINTTDTDTVALNDKKDTDGTLTDLSEFNNTMTSTKSGVDTDTTTYGKNEREAHTGTESYTSHSHGNIGVTTNQQMITSEIELRRYDVYTDIAMRFEKEFLMQLY